MLVADEPTTALDATVQAEVLDLLGELQARRGLGLLLISHDLGVIAGRTRRVAVMYAGRIVEQAPVARLFDAPLHPYTRALLEAAPGSAVSGVTSPGRRRLRVIEGTVPSAADMPPGCAFAPRCPDRLAQCGSIVPPTVAIDGDREVACHLHPALEGGATRGAR